ncbi:MAG: hypothetical protein QM755_03240 [Luteolibacter sp.]
MEEPPSPGSRRVIRLTGWLFFVLFLSLWMAAAASVFCEEYPAVADELSFASAPRFFMYCGATGLLLLLAMLPLWAIGLGIGSSPGFSHGGSGSR